VSTLRHGDSDESLGHGRVENIHRSGWCGTGDISEEADGYHLNKSTVAMMAGAWVMGPAATLVFIVFIAVETWQAIIHLIGSIH
jgi:hypothetical protein